MCYQIASLIMDIQGKGAGVRTPACLQNYILYYPVAGKRAGGWGIPVKLLYQSGLQCGS